MSDDPKLVYSSSNGDRWFIVREAASSRPLVRHEPNRSSGGSASELAVEDFLRRDGEGPQHQAVRAALAAEPQSDAGEAARPRRSGLEQAKASLITSPQIRAGRGLLGWSQERLAQESQTSLDEIIRFESGLELVFTEGLGHVAQALGLAGIVLISEGEVTSGGPGVRMGSLGTSTGQPAEVETPKGNDNAPAEGLARSGATN